MHEPHSGHRRVSCCFACSHPALQLFAPALHAGLFHRFSTAFLGIFSPEAEDASVNRGKERPQPAKAEAQRENGQRERAKGTQKPKGKTTFRKAENKTFKTSENPLNKQINNIQFNNNTNNNNDNDNNNNNNKCKT